MTNDMRRLVVGPGGTGRTHLLRTWVDELDTDSDTNPSDAAIWLTGHYSRTVKAAAVVDAVATNPAILVLDDLQWFEDEALEAILEAIETPKANGISVFASRRTWPMSTSLRAMSDLLTENEPAVRTAFLADEEFAQIASSFIEGAASTKVLAELHQVTGGSLGLAADAVAADWSPEHSETAAQLVEAIVTRVSRCGPDAVALVQVLAVAPGLPLADLLNSLDDSVDHEGAERATKAGGMLDEAELLLPIVRSAVVADLPSAAKSRIHDRLAVALIRRHPDHAANSVMLGRGDTPGSEAVLITAAQGLQHSDPARAIDMVDHGLACGFDRAELGPIRLTAAYEQGSRDAMGYLDDLPATHPLAALVGFGLDIRDLRWQAAAARPVLPLQQLAMAFAGDLVVPSGEVSDANSRLVTSLVNNLNHLANGDSRQALAGFAEAADDYDRVHPDVPLGITPHAVGAAAAIGAGDLATSQGLLEQAISAQSGGQGEEATHRLLLAYTRLLGGNFKDALAAMREGEGSGWSLRDRFVLAAIDAAIARRSGDTTRLRDAWSRADPVLVRTSASWLFADLTVELLAAGSRLGETRRVQPIADELAKQLLGLPATGAGAVGAHWLNLQIGLAAGNKGAVGDACDALRTLTPTDDRSEARINASAEWVDIQSQSIDDESLSNTARLLVSVGDGWEASRLLGQAALDHPDPPTARRLLEAARTLAVEPEAAGESGLLALGLSEREAEVALLVAAGRTYKEVGAQLYVSPKTVEHHVAHIRRKIGASSRAEFLAAIKAAVDT